ncbi:hypothetical protein AVEN_113071-1 [Araneus ventricosus]|uniref:Uncharacterized protein n=1 Tax=Araneus ventricosus TaxID=182803 RepID=A0A4Y2VRS0_ARAVE|nr:hypothetical protein AVEN_113071-1 [Araneus ventricosus]
MGPPANTYAGGPRAAQGPIGPMTMESRKRPAPDRSDGRSQGAASSKSGPPQGSNTGSASDRLQHWWREQQKKKKLDGRSFQRKSGIWSLNRKPTWIC